MGQTYGWVGSKHCLLRLIKLEPGEFIFQFFTESLSFLFSLFFVSLQEAFCGVWNCCHLFFVGFLNLPFPLHEFWAMTIDFLKNYQRIFASDLYNKQVAEMSHFRTIQKTRRWRYIEVVSRSPYPTKAWLPLITLSSVKWAFFVFFYAVSIIIF